MDERLLEILPSVTKPARYTNNEINSVHKDWAATAVKVALAFPDTYEVGMGHLGYKILYAAINGREDALAERVYAPWVDLEDKMRANKIPLTSLESGQVLRDFDLVGFTLQYELSYTNILRMLDLGGIPRYTRDRGEEDPLVIAGGPCAFNVEPLADFLDFVVLGDGEEVIHEIISLSKLAEEEGLSRAEKLARLAQIPGIYIPSLYTAQYNDDGSFRRLIPLDAEAPAHINKRVVQDLNDAVFPSEFVVPYIDVVHDRVMVEVFRGCTRGCRFCQAGMIYRPVRERNPQLLKEQIDRLVASTGYDEISLTSLSSGDYSCIEPLVIDLIKEYGKQGIGVSLPSLRLDSFSVGLAEQIEKSRKTGLTFAPEAGTQRLRDVINKNVTEEDLYSVVKGAFQSGWHSVKLYFMIGLPTETEEDLEGIVQLANNVLDIGRQYRKGPKRPEVTVSVSSFVPKPHTPFQWEPQEEMDTLRQKQAFLRQRLSRPGLRFSYHHVETSYLEGVFARGDRRLSAVLARAVDLGCRFDGWNEQFKYDTWMQAFADTDVDPTWYTHRERAEDESLPWEHLNAGVSKAYLLRERSAAKRVCTTPDCRYEGCTGCAVCPDLNVENRLVGGEHS